MPSFRENLTKFVQQTEEMRAILDWMDDLAPQVLSEKRFEQVNKIRAGCVVLLSGYFEEYLKSSVKGFCGELAAAKIEFSEVGEDLQKSYFQAAARFIDRGSKGDGWKQPDARSQLLEAGKRIAELTRGAPIDLFWEELADTRGTPGPEVVHGLPRSLGVRDFWAGGDASLRSGLDTFLQQRNRCAHGGSSAQPPEAAVIRTDIELLQTLATEIAKALSEHVARFPIAPHTAVPVLAN